MNDLMGDVGKCFSCAFVFLAHSLVQVWYNYNHGPTHAHITPFWIIVRMKHLQVFLQSVFIV